MKQPTAIIIGDLHLRNDTPECRKDDFIETQIHKLEWLNEAIEKYQCDHIIIPGDIFHKAKPEPEVIKMAIDNLPRLIASIPGNHDLPNHSFKKLNQSGYSVLESTHTIINTTNENILDDNITVIGFPFNEIEKRLEEIKEMKFPTEMRIAVAHIFTYKGRLPWKDCDAPGCTKVMDMFEDFDLIVTGDNHQPFTHKNNKGQLLINAGSFTRQRTTETHKPRIYLWYAETNTAEPVYVPIEKDVISTEHINKKNNREKRISLFVSKLTENIEVGLSFENNIKKFFQSNKISQSIESKVWRAIEND